MKTKKLLAFLSLVFVAGLVVACKPKESSISEKPSGSTSDTSQPAPSTTTSIEESTTTSTAPIPKTIEYVETAIETIENKPYISFVHAVTGYTLAELEALTPYFDAQSNPRAQSNGTSWSGPWTRYTNVASDSELRKPGQDYGEALVPLLVSLVDNEAKFSFDLSVLPDYCYTIHFDLLNETVGAINTDNYADFKKDEPGETTITVGDVDYTLICDPTDMDGVHYWGCFGIKVKTHVAVETSIEITGQDLLLADETIYLLLTGECENYTETSIQEVTLDANLQDVVGHPYHTTGYWTLFPIADEKMSIRLVDETHFEIRIDISEFGPNAYVVHIGIDAPADDCKTGVATDVSLEFNGLIYNLIVDPDSTGAAGFWGNQGLVVRDPTAKSHIFTGGEARIVDDKAYFVVTGEFANYTEEDLDELTKVVDVEPNWGHSDYTGSPDKIFLTGLTQIVVIDDSHFELLTDITDLPLNAYYTHTIVNGEGNGDIKPGVEIDSSVTLGDKVYRVVCFPDGNSGQTFYSNLALVITEAPVEP